MADEVEALAALDAVARAMTGTLLGVWAHPDDEAYLSAGLMADARRRGDRVVVVTATAGEHGTDDPTAGRRAGSAARRRRELRASLAALGVHEHHLLGYRDGGCRDVDGSDRIAEIVDDVRPDTIVTFGPDGMTGHPDHRAVSAWTTDAWQATGRRARLWYATLTPDFHAAGARSTTTSACGPTPTGRRAPSEDDLAHSVAARRALLDQKLVALRAHASQTAPLVDLVGEATYRAWWRSESFVDARDHRRLADRELIGVMT